LFIFSSERSSTRLHAPPGGKSSFSIGGYTEEEKAPAQRRPRGNEPAYLADYAPKNAQARQTEQPQRVEQEFPNKKSYGRQMSRQYENVAPTADVHQHSGAPPVTGAKQSTRVMHAPGGRSSIVIG